jgi:hypothetical protein
LTIHFNVISHLRLGLASRRLPSEIGDNWAEKYFLFFVFRLFIAFVIFFHSTPFLITLADLRITAAATVTKSKAVSQFHLQYNSTAMDDPCLNHYNHCFLMTEAQNASVTFGTCYEALL